SSAKFVMSLHYYTLSCAKKSLMFRRSPCSGPKLGKCLQCATDHYGLLKGLTVLIANWSMSAVERSAVDFFLPVSHATAAGNGLLGGEQYDIIPNFMPNEIGAAHDVEPYLAQLPKVPFLLFVGDLRREKG